MAIARLMRPLSARPLLALAAGLALSQAALAAPMLGGAYEGFDYSGDPVAGQIIQANNLAGGAGWNATGDVNLPNSPTSRWGDATALPAAGGTGPAKRVLYPTLSYTATGYPTSTGGKATIDATIANQTNNVSRNMQQLVDSGSFYFSYLTDKNNDTMRTTTL